jgi:hypothetical protein
LLHALAAWILLQLRGSLCRCAVRKLVIHANRSENETLKEKVAGLCSLLLVQFSLTQRTFAFAAGTFLRRSLYRLTSH